MPLRSRLGNTRRPTYWYRCCSKSEVEQVWEPGQTSTLHWLAGEPGAPDLPTRYVTLHAELVGPYRDPFAKIADADLRTVTAPDITADTWEVQKPVTSIVLPADLPNGLYQLRLKVLIAVDFEESAQGTGVVSESIGVIRADRGDL